MAAACCSRVAGAAGEAGSPPSFLAGAWTVGAAPGVCAAAGRASVSTVSTLPRMPFSLKIHAPGLLEECRPDARDLEGLHSKRGCVRALFILLVAMLVGSRRGNERSLGPREPVPRNWKLS